MRFTLIILLIAINFSCKNSSQANKSENNPNSYRDESWALLPFIKADEVNPILIPDSKKKYEGEGGCEDPRIVEDQNGSYYLTYTGYNGDKARLMIASSKDLYHWTKYGHAFANAYQGKYINEWSKSGSIVCKYENGKAIAIKINGKYWMYWGDTDIFLASSDDLIQWTPVENNES